VVGWLTARAARQQFDRFVSEATDRLVRTAYLMTADPCEAEDLAQETLIRVARHWDRVRAMDQPAAYARRVLVNLVIDGGVRRRRRSDELSGGDPGDPDGIESQVDPSSAHLFGLVDGRVEFRSALATLPARQRAVVVLRYWEDMSENEVAALLGCSAGTVKSTASRGLARLRAALAHDSTSSYGERTQSSC
jgi:RNA polymerase sigma-70 factor (sigma-E family)